MSTLSYLKTSAPRSFAFYILVFIAVLALTSDAQPIQPEVLFKFPVPPMNPSGSLAQGPDGNFYGTTVCGGRADVMIYSSPPGTGGPCAGYGTVFKVTTNGDWSTLVAFANTNGAYPHAGLTLGPDGNFYGTTYAGGDNGYGTVFRVTTNGALTTLVSFANTNGANPQTALTLGRDGCLYGTTLSGGHLTQLGSGTAFRITTNGVLTTLVMFADYSSAAPSVLTLGPDGSFYGTTLYGGGVSQPGLIYQGTVFKMTRNGVFTTLATFTSTNNTGGMPSALTLGNDGSFYGTTDSGGSSGYGTIFKVTTDGVLTLVSSWEIATAPPTALTLGNDGNFYGVASDNGSGVEVQLTSNGALTLLAPLPYGFGSVNSALTLGSDGAFYGSTQYGMDYNSGALFRVTTDGTFTALTSFAAPDGDGPGALTLGDDGNLYGTTPTTVFVLSTNGTFKTLSNTNYGAPPQALTLGGDGNFYGVIGAAVEMVTTNGSVSIFVPRDVNNNLFGPYSLVLGNDGNLYGTADRGGTGVVSGGGYGTVFEVTTNGSLTTLDTFSFAGGAWPYGGLTLGPDGNFYGTTSAGGQFGYGTLFEVTPSGALTTLLAFDGTNGSGGYFAPTLGNDGALYGVSGAAAGLGLMFRVTTNGDVTTVASFDSNTWNTVSRKLTLGPDGNFYGIGGGQFNWGLSQVTSNGDTTMFFSIGMTNLSFTAPVLGTDGDLYWTSSGGGDGFGAVYRLKHGAYIQSLGMSGNGFGLDVLNVGGSGMVVLESSRDLRTWTPIQTNGPGGTQHFLDPNVIGQPAQFYRVLQQ